MNRPLSHKDVVLGIDPGLKATGYGLVCSEEDALFPALRLIEAGTIEPRPRGSLPERVHSLHRQLDTILKEHRPAICILEKLYAHSRHPTTACVLGHARGIVCLVCAQWGVPVEEYSVKRIRKAVVGQGNAGKEQTRRAVSQIFHVKPENLSLDASDALALAAGFIYMNQSASVGRSPGRKVVKSRGTILKI